MHGLINKAIETFAIDTYGAQTWLDAVAGSGAGVAEFESMLVYDQAIPERLLAALSRLTGNPRETLLENLGTFLVTSPELPEIRRLLRYGGVSYEDFLLSLDDLADRVRLAVEDLHLPELGLTAMTGSSFVLHCGPGLPGFGHVIVGVLRAMADDYGTLALLDHRGAEDGSEAISVVIVEDDFSTGRRFELGERRA